MTSADLLLHPVRLQIIQAFLGDRALTTSQLQSEIPEVPAPSLYRHVGRLVNAGVLAVVAERRVRGAVERTYVLRMSAAAISVADAARMSAQDHRQAFLAFTAGLIRDFLRDGVSYRLAALWLTDKELTELGRDILAALQPRLANPPKRGRKRRMLATILLPGPETRP
jgi:hypothetical protein